MEGKVVHCRSDANYTFLIGGSCPYTRNTNHFFFHSSEFLADQPNVAFYILNNRRQSCEGVFNLSVLDQVGYSPLKAPFGSMDINPSTSPEILADFLNCILQWAEGNNLQAIKIKHYPQCYDTAGTALAINSYFNHEFQISNADIAQYMLVQAPQCDLSSSERGRLNKCKKAGFVWEKLENFSSRAVYDLIKDCKDRKGYPTTMSFDALEKKLIDFPETYLVFGVKDGQRLIAVSICIVINTTVLYDFTHGHSEGYDTFSPVVYLIDGIYSYCFEKGYKILDLGLSTEDSSVNSGLFAFKARLGTQSTLKLSFMKRLKQENLADIY